MKKEAKKRRNNSLRIIATNIFMGLSVLVIVAVLVGIAMGYTINKNGELEQSGLLRVKSVPSDAQVEIDGERQFSRTEMSKLLSAGTRDIVVTKDGYDIWRSKVRIEEGLMMKLDWVRLFPTEEVIETVRGYKKGLRLMSVSPDRRYVLVLGQNEKIAQIIDVKNDDIVYSKLNLTEVLALEKEEEIDGELKIIEWSKNSDKLLIYWDRNDLGAFWILADTLKPENSVNLTEVLSMDFADLQILSETADRIWALDDGNLRVISLGDELSISSVLLRQVEKIASKGTNLIYVGKNIKEKRVIGVYKEGEKEGAVIQELGEGINNVNIAVSEFGSKKWVAYSLDGRYFVRRANEIPSYRQAVSGLKIIAENDLGFVPDKITASPNGRFAAALASDGVSMFDIDVDERLDYNAYLPENGNFGWLNNYLLWSSLDGLLSVRDFTGDNVRELATVEDGFPVLMTANNHWLYFVQGGEDGRMQLVRKKVY